MDGNIVAQRTFRKSELKNVAGIVLVATILLRSWLRAFRDGSSDVGGYAGRFSRVKKEKHYTRLVKRLLRISERLTSIRLCASQPANQSMVCE